MSTYREGTLWLAADVLVLTRGPKLHAIPLPVKSAPLTGDGSATPEQLEELDQWLQIFGAAALWFRSQAVHPAMLKSNADGVDDLPRAAELAQTLAGELWKTWNAAVLNARGLGVFELAYCEQRAAGADYTPALTAGLDRLEQEVYRAYCTEAQEEIMRGGEENEPAD